VAQFEAISEKGKIEIKAGRVMWKGMEKKKCPWVRGAAGKGAACLTMNMGSARQASGT